MSVNREKMAGIESSMSSEDQRADIESRIERLMDEFTLRPKMGDEERKEISRQVKLLQEKLEGLAKK